MLEVEKLETTRFDSEGYIVLKELIPEVNCDQLVYSFMKEVKPYKKPLLRQRNVSYEPHSFSRDGLMNNALLDVHLLKENLFPNFKNDLKAVLADFEIKNNAKRLLKTEPILAQTMYFEGSKGTPKHFDNYFVGDSQTEPQMIGFWLALEDIDEGAGPFYLYPKSHQNLKECPEAEKLFIEYEQINLRFQASQPAMSRSDALKFLMRGKVLIDQLIHLTGWKKETPSLQKGDAIFFKGNLLHGSEVPKGTKSRNSLTSQFVPFSENCEIQYRGSKHLKMEHTQFGPLKVNISNRLNLFEKQNN